MYKEEIMVHPEDEFADWVKQVNWMHKPWLYRALRNEFVYIWTLFDDSPVERWFILGCITATTLLSVVIFPVGIFGLTIWLYGAHKHKKADIKIKDWRGFNW